MAQLAVKKHRKDYESVFIKLFAHSTLLIFALFCIIPFIVVISVSLSDDSALIKYGYTIFPKVIKFDAYKFIFLNPKEIINAYWVTIKVTVMGVLSSLLICSLIAYPLSRKDFKYRRQVGFILYFTCLFNGGLVPTYILITQWLHLQNTIWVMFVPNMVGVWYILLMRNFFSTIPMELIESAKIDGCGEYILLFRIILPLSKASLATISVFMLLGYWNDWFASMLYITDKNLINLQYMLYKIMSNLQALAENMNKMPVGLDMNNLPTESTRMAICIVAAGPMMFVFPFFQKYFAKGITLGAVKG